MFGIILYDILFFMIPTVLLVLFGVSLYRYNSAKKQNKQNPGTFSDGEIKKRKLFLIVMAVITGALVVVVVGFVALLFMAVAFM